MEALNNYILIKNGVLVSKEHDSIQMDILIKDDKIFDIQKSIPVKVNFKVVNAQHKIVSPGFVDFHSHCDFYLPFKEHQKLYEPLLFQGVTTCLGGNCGLSMFPIVKDKLDYFKDYTGFLLYGDIDFDWDSYENYLKKIGNNILFNFASLTGLGTLRVDAAGFKKVLNEKDYNFMVNLLEETLHSGSFGISSGISYMPGTYSDTDELIKFAKIARKYPNTIYTSHMRGYSHNFVKSIEEIIEIGKKTGIKVHCSHLGPFGVQFANKIKEVLELIHNARDNGIDITFDSLGYLGGNTTIMAIFPTFSLKNGIEKFLEDIKNDKFYNELVQFIENYIPQWPPWKYDGWTDNLTKSLGWENIIILGSKNKDLFGKNFIEIAKERKTNIYDALREVLLEENADITIYFKGVGGALDDNDPNIKFFDLMIEDELSLIAVDAVFSKTGVTMPFLYGTFPRIINRYVKLKKTLTLKQAVEKFSYNAINRLNISKRGNLKKGYFADIVVFDFEKFKDNANFTTQELATGLEYLLINGKIVIGNGLNYTVKNGYILKNK